MLYLTAKVSKEIKIEIIDNWVCNDTEIKNIFMASTKVSILEWICWHLILLYFLSLIFSKEMHRYKISASSNFVINKNYEKFTHGQSY